MFNRLFSLWRKPATVPARVAAQPMPTSVPHAPYQTPTSARTVSRPSVSGIDYHPGLVGDLKDEHAALVRTYGAIGAAMQKGEWAEASRQLRALRTMLTDHFLKERVLLYCYLQNMLPRGDKQAWALFQDFKVEMGSIGKAAMSFVDRHAAPEVFLDPRVRSAFSEEYDAIGKVLAERIGREETQLYPMYRMPSTPVH
jgi:hypothetical protein